MLGVQYWSMFSISGAYEYDACTTESTLVVLQDGISCQAKKSDDGYSIASSSTHPGMHDEGPDLENLKHSGF